MSVPPDVRMSVLMHMPSAFSAWGRATDALLGACVRTVSLLPAAIFALAFAVLKYPSFPLSAGCRTILGISMTLLTTVSEEVPSRNGR